MSVQKFSSLKNLKLQDVKIGIVWARFNEQITRSLLEASQRALMQAGLKESDVDIFDVPGAFEIPSVAQKIANAKTYDAIICLGTVIRGSTPHFEYVASEVSKGIARVSQDSGIPVIFGVITADTIEQAIERAGTKDGNKGSDAASSAIEMANLFEKLS